VRTDEEPRVGVALSGGIAKVIAHVGVLRALVEAGIPIHAVAATSGGAIVGALFAAGLPPAEIERIARGASWKKLTRVTIPKLGLLSSERIGQFVVENGGRRTFEELDLTFAVVGANLSTGGKVVFTRGELGPALRATCAIPQVFTPAPIDGDLISDGGLVEYLPIETLRDLGCDVTIGVNLGSVRSWDEDPRNLIEVALRVMSFVAQRNAVLSERLADHVIRPDLSAFSPHDLDRAHELVEIGYAAGRAALPALTELLKRKRRERTRGGRGPWRRLLGRLRGRS
jgi:NTE family protein